MSQHYGKGRSRGRSRPEEGHSSRPGSSSSTSSSRSTSAWGQGNPMRSSDHPQPPPPPATSAWGQHGPQRTAAPPPSSAGRAAYRGGAEGPSRSTERPMEHSGLVTGGGNGGDTHSGRGAHRGGRQIAENIIVTKCAVGKQGESGQKVTLTTNYFRLEKKPDWVIFQYRVDFSPEIDETFTKKKMFYGAIKDTVNIKGLFDGTMLFTPFRLSPDPQELFVDSPTEDGVKYRITIRMVGEMTHGNYQYLMIYNLILRKCMSHLKLQLVGRDYYDPKAKIDVQRMNLELWPGIISSIRQHERDLLWCVDIKYKVMKNSTALDLIHECMRDSEQSRGRVDWRQLFSDRILNKVVITRYNNKTYKIDDIEFDSTPMSTFELKDLSKQTFSEYYRVRYGLPINNQKQPLLVSKSKQRELRAGAPEIVKLVPELCNLTGLSEAERNDHRKMMDIAEYMRPSVQKRVDNLERFSRRLHTEKNSMDELRYWDLKMSDRIISVPGRVLPMEGIAYKEGEYSAGRESDWGREFRNKRMYREGDMKTWAIAYPPRQESGMRNFYNLMCKAADGLHWRLNKPIIKCMSGQDQQSYNRIIEDLCGAYPDLKMIVVVVPKFGDYYSFVKKKLTVDRGVCSQLVAQNTLGHKNAMSIATKIIVQMNAKCGGAPWTVKLPADVMFCGYDVCHDPKNKSRSYGAFVASMDFAATSYYHTVAHHLNGDEISGFIAISMAKSLHHYRKCHDALPAKILFYRDGVGEGNLGYVYEFELANMRAEVNKIYAAQNQKAQLRMIVVNKRINTRLFCQGQNPRPGTVVDDVITLPERTDFFLIPQCTRQGTVSPTYYNILGPDDFGYSIDRTQMMTYKLCHQYYNWTGTVRVPAPCQYAHKLAFQVAQFLQRTPKENLCDVLHFL